MDTLLKRGEFSERSGLSIRTIRHYEELGLLKPCHINDKGYHYYAESDVLKMKDILNLKFLGLSLEEIKAAMDQDYSNIPALFENKREELYATLKESEWRIKAVDDIAKRFDPETISREQVNTVIDDKTESFCLDWLSNRFPASLKKSLDLVIKSDIYPERHRRMKASLTGLAKHGHERPESLAVQMEVKGILQILSPDIIDELGACRILEVASRIAGKGPKSISFIEPDGVMFFQRALAVYKEQNL